MRWFEMIRLPATFAVFAIAAFASHADAKSDWLAIAAQLAPRGAVDFTPNGTQPGLIYTLHPPGECSSCHGGFFDQGDTTGTFRPFPTWGGSMMANATRDPLFWAAVDVANHDVPGAGDYCLRCHTAEGWYGGRVVKSGFGGPPNDVTLGAAGCFLNGTYDKQDFDNDFDGVSCHFCHRLMPEGPDGEPAYLENGNAWLDDAECTNPDSGITNEPCRRGPFQYSTSGAQPPHAWEHSDYHTQSAICGLCHNVTSPDTDAGPLKTLKLADGTDTGRPFPIERTYAEWKQSQYSEDGGQTCQACHMPMSEDPNASACALGGFPNRTGTLPVHEFVGGNTWIPSVIKGQYDDTSGIPGSQGGLGRGASFDQTITWAREQLGRAAALDVAVTSFAPPAGDAAGSLDLGIKVTNLTGHKLPTGYSEGRRMWLNVQVHDANGALVFESAAYDSTTAALTVDAQARVYETFQGIWNHNGSGTCDAVDASGDPMFHFVLSDCIAKDNRIPPLGFMPATADDPNGYELRPVGATYPETSPGSGVLVNFDSPSYHVAVPVGTALPLTANARLYYQTSSREYIEFLRNEAVENGFAAENAMCSAAGNPNRPFVVGPQDRTRGEYIYELWNNASDDAGQPGYGKSPPELMQVASVTTSDVIFEDGFDGAP
jgi:hypothetical protein